MGIRDRDYMKRPSDDGGQHGSPPDSKAEELARRFFTKYPHFLLYFGIAIGIMIVIALIIAKYSGAAH